MRTHTQIERFREMVSGGKRPLLIALLLLGGGLTQAQTNYSITCARIAGGGGTCTNGQISLSGTLGQYDASAPLIGGGYSLTGGIWAGMAGVVQTPGAPFLSITRSGANLVLSWAGPANGYILQQTPALPDGAWTEVNQNPVDKDGIRSVTVAIGPANQFFRLRK